MCTYLLPTPTGYYFRRSIPENLRPFFDGKRQFKFSLRTKDRATAKRLIPEYTIATDAQLDAARKALERVAEPPATHAVPACPKSPAALERERARWEWEQEQADLLSAALDEQDSEIEALEPVMDALEQGREPHASPAEIAKAGRLAILHAREIGAYEALKAERKQAAVQAVPTKPEQAAPTEPSGKGIYLDTDILKLWAAESKPGAKGRAAYESSAKRFYAVIGRKSVELVTKSDVMAYKARMIADGKTQVNVRDHLGYIRTLFNCAAQGDLVSSNPAQDVRMRVTEKASKRQDFKIDDLNSLFSGPVHAKGERPKAGGGEAAYWLPLLALFMGARREEIGQLRISDVRKAPYVDEAEQRQEVWCVNITDTPDDDGLANQIKNAASERLIPLHPKLIELGFVEYVQGLPDQRGRVFPALKPMGVGQKLTDKWGQWFSSYKKDCGITDKAKVFHSFRHTWKTHAVEAGLEERICRAFQGHEGKDAADKYGQAPSMLTMVKAIASYQVRGLNLPQPVPD